MPDQNRQDRVKSEFCNCPPELLLTLSVSMALSISRGLTSDEILVFADFISMLGSQLTFIADHSALCQSSTGSGGASGSGGSSEQSGQGQFNNHGKMNNK